MSSQEVKQIMDEADLNNDGKLNYREVKFMNFKEFFLIIFAINLLKILKFIKLFNETIEQVLNQNKMEVNKRGIHFLIHCKSLRISTILEL